MPWTGPASPERWKEKDGLTAAKLDGLAALHDRKVGALMKSITGLRAEVKKLKGEAKEHRRSQLIQSLRTKLREQELAVDVLKEALCERTAMAEDAVNDLVILRTLGGPKRFRPKTREELQNELVQAQRTILSSQKPRQRRPETPEEKGNDDDEKDEEKDIDLPSTKDLREMTMVMRELEEAQVTKSRLDLELAEAKRGMEKLRREKEDALRAAEQFERQAAGAAELERRFMDCRMQRESAAKEAASREGDVEALKMDLDHLKAMAAADVDAMKMEVSKTQRELSKALAQQIETKALLDVAEEKAKRALQGEVAAKKHAESRIHAADRAVRDAVRERDRVQQRYDDRELTLRSDVKNLQDRARGEVKQKEKEKRHDIVEVTRQKSLAEQRASDAEKAKAAAETLADVLRHRVDEIQHDLNAAKEAHLDDKADFEMTERALQDRITALERARDVDDCQKDNDMQATDANLSKLALRQSRARLKLDKLEAEQDRERLRRERAEAFEAGAAERRAMTDGLVRDLRLENEDLRKKIHQLETAGLMATEKSDVLKKENDQLLRAKELADDTARHELKATRNALIAHVRLADVYAQVHDGLASKKSRLPNAPATKKALEKAQGELQRALAASPTLEAFYYSVRKKIEQFRPSIAQKPQQPSQQPSPQEKPQSPRPQEEPQQPQEKPQFQASPKSQEKPQDDSQASPKPKEKPEEPSPKPKEEALLTPTEGLPPPFKIRVDPAELLAPATVEDLFSHDDDGGKFEIKAPGSSGSSGARSFPTSDGGSSSVLQDRPPSTTSSSRTSKTPRSFPDSLSADSSNQRQAPSLSSVGSSTALND